MNLLNNIFNIEDYLIKKTNRQYLIISSIIILIMISLLMIKINKYYISNYSVIDNSVFLMVDKEMINEIKNTKEIIISNINSNYSINNITSIENNYLVNITLETVLNNIQNGEYKINLGKERLFDYIIRIIIK